MRDRTTASLVDKARGRVLRFPRGRTDHRYHRQRQVDDPIDPRICRLIGHGRHRDQRSGILGGMSELAGRRRGLATRRREPRRPWPDRRLRPQIHWRRDRAHPAQAADDRGCRARVRRLARHGVARAQRRTLGEPCSPAKRWSARQGRPATASTRTPATSATAPRELHRVPAHRVAGPPVRGPELLHAHARSRRGARRPRPAARSHGRIGRRAATRTEFITAGHVDGALLVSSHREREGS